MAETVNEDILALAETVRDAAVADSSTLSSPLTHQKLLDSIRNLRHAVETPSETLLRLIYQPPQNATLRVIVELGLATILVDRKQENNEGVSATELASLTSIDRTLITRLMRVIVALGLCSSPRIEVYEANEKTKVLTESIGRDGVQCLYDLTLPALAKLPEYLRVHNFVNPEDYTKSPMQWAVGVSQFEWLAQDMTRQAVFNSYMSSRRQGVPSWFEFYPIERLLSSILHNNYNAALIVDVGGNRGHDLQKFRGIFPDVPGRLILQDLPSVIVSIPKLDGIEAMGYDFFEPQPVRGALAYTFRAIFHDWPDHICRRILANTIPAMTPGYSKIIIVDFVLPDVDAPLLQASMDIQMMSIGAGMERSESQWKKLIASAGLEILSIYNSKGGMEAVIEAVPLSYRDQMRSPSAQL